MSTEPSPEPTNEAAFFTTIRSWGIVRSDERVFGGVLAGAGRRVGMAPAPARIIFVLLALVTFGLAALLYAAAWALLPDSEGRIIIQDFGRGRPNVGALVAIAILAIVGLSTIGHFGFANIFRYGDGRNFDWVPVGRMDGISGLGRLMVILAAVVIPLLILGGIAALIVWIVRSARDTNRAAQGFAVRPDGTVPDGTVPDAPPSPAVVAEEAGVASAAATATYAAPGPAPAPSPRVYTAPPTPPKPRVPGPGKMGYLMALAWIPITLAITLYLSTTDQLAVFPVLAAGVIYVAGLGVILIITALRGRKLGFLGFVSAMSLIPVALSIGFATDLREQYADGSHWRGWVHDQGWGNLDGEPSQMPEPSIGPDPEPAFNPTATFSDYATVAIAGHCSSDYSGPAPDATGTISLGDVSAPTTLTIATDVTHVVIPEGTNLSIVAPSNWESDPYVGVTWVDRGVSCSMTSGVKDFVTLNNPDAPVLTLVLGDANSVGQFDIYIEEN